MGASNSSNSTPITSAFQDDENGPDAPPPPTLPHLRPTSGHTNNLVRHVEAVASAPIPVIELILATAGMVGVTLMGIYLASVVGQLYWNPEEGDQLSACAIDGDTGWIFPVWGAGILGGSMGTLSLRHFFATRRCTSTDRNDIAEIMGASLSYNGPNAMSHEGLVAALQKKNVKEILAHAQVRGDIQDPALITAGTLVFAIGAILNVVAIGMIIIGTRRDFAVGLMVFASLPMWAASKMIHAHARNVNQTLEIVARALKTRHQNNLARAIGMR